MGCDIHSHVEKRVNGQWLAADNWVKDPPDWYSEGEEIPLVVPFNEQIYGDRNYNLFAILANVRNGCGFAGIKTGSGFNIISEPRGIPEDACEEYKLCAERYGIDGHSHSWLTLDEVLSFDWTQTTMLEGDVDIKNYFETKLRGEPKEWCGAVLGNDIEHVTNETIDKAAESLNLKGWECIRPEGLKQLSKLLGNVITRVSWQRTYAECCKEFWWKSVPKLLSLGKPEDVRLVFFFDN